MMGQEKVLVSSRDEVLARGLDLEDLKDLDSIKLGKEQYKKGLIKALLLSLIGIIVFFFPINIGGKSDVVFGFIYGGLKNASGVFGLWFVTLMTLFTGILSIYGTYIAKSGKIYEYFHGESKIMPIFYNLGGIFTLLYTLSATTNFKGPEIIVGNLTGGTVVPGITLGVFWVILVSSLFMPFLLNYGVVDFIGALLEPIMRPLLKVPGRAAMNCLAAIVSSASVGVLMTAKQFKRGVYTQREAVLVATGFAAVSIGWSYMITEMADLSDQFLFIYLISILMIFIISGIVARIPPFSNKKDVFIDGRVQSPEDIKAASRNNGGIVKTGVERAAKKAYLAPNLFSEIKTGLIEGFQVIPKVCTMISAIGVIVLILAEFTPVMDILGKPFIPLLSLLRVPNASEIASAFPAGITEQTVPVLLIADKVAQLERGARFMVVVVSQSQIIFFAETVVTMLSAKLPLNVKELVIVFFQRTLIGIVLGALLMHLIY